MAATTDMNIILGQADAINEVHNVRKQQLELNQQFVAQKGEEKKKEDKSKVPRFQDGSRIEAKYNDEQNRKEGQKDNKREKKHQPSEEGAPKGEGNLIDIKV